MEGHLWDYDHPYYMCEGNYYKAGEHTDYHSFDDFLEAWSGMDIDLNRVHRFDWIEAESPEHKGQGTLSIYFVLQRKARLMSCDIEVTASDEPKVIEYLRPHYEREAALWQPFGSAATTKLKDQPNGQ